MNRLIPDENRGIDSGRKFPGRKFRAPAVEVIDMRERNGAAADLYFLHLKLWSIADELQSLHDWGEEQPGQIATLLERLRGAEQETAAAFRAAGDELLALNRGDTQVSP